MALIPKYRVQSIEPQAGGNIHCDTYVLLYDDELETESVRGHFTVVLSAADVLALAALGKPERIAGYKALFYADQRIASITDACDAATQMEDDIPFPVTVSF